MNSKLGLHIQQRRRGWSNVIADSVPALVKTLDWTLVDDWIAEEQRDPPSRKRAEKWRDHGVFLLGRQVMAAQSLDQPQDWASAFWDGLLDRLTGGQRQRDRETLQRMRLFDAWAGYNQVGSGVESANLGRFDALLARTFHREGIRYAGGGFSMTGRTREEWIRYCEALLGEVASGRGERPDLLHLHEYWFPAKDYDALLNSDRSIDVERMRAATKGHVLHWRDLYTDAATPPELRLPLIISECGWDRGQPEQVGFRRSGLSDEDYVRWLVWYDQELQVPLQGVDYVVGAAIFTYGHTARWETFEIDRWHGRGILDLLRAYLRDSNRERHPRLWERANQPEGGPAPGVQESHYVLLARQSTASWRHALARYLDTFKVTNGQSLEDALGLAAACHHITLVGSADSALGLPRAWEEEIRRRNPRILIDRMEARTAAELRRLANLRAERGDRYGEQDQLR